VRKEQGFTVVELLIVVGILAVIVGVVATNASGTSADGLAEDRAAELSLVKTAIDTYNEQDVAGGQSPIPARVEPAPIAAADQDAPFAKYLPSDTAYSYRWGMNGTDLGQN